MHLSKSVGANYNDNQRGELMACPYFIPSTPHPRELWAHRGRLPLGDGFTGTCATCPGPIPGDEALRLQCNLGYAECVNLPTDRYFDAIRFQCAAEGSAMLRLSFACERQHRPAFCGELKYDRISKCWIEPPDSRLLALAQAAVRAWIARNENPRMVMT